MQVGSKMRRLAIALLALGIALLVPPSQTSAAPAKVLHLSFRSVETGFDPQRIQDVYSNAVSGEIFDSALEFDYLARPVKLVPRITREVPQPGQNGLVYTFRFSPDIFFANDAAFKGKRRELTARDQEYALKRLIDPAVRSPYSWLVENRIEGLDALAAQAKKSGRFDYDAPVSGLKLLDRYTLQIKLTKPDFNFLYIFTMPQTSPVAREVMEAYPDDTMAHPVGTGPFKLVEWVRRSKIVLERNENFRDKRLDATYADPDDPWDREVIKHIADKRLPLLDRVEIYPMDAEQPRFLSFMNGDHDLLQETPFSYVSKVVPNGKIAPNLAKQGIRAFLELQPEIVYYVFNMEDAVVGGYDPQHVALRRAMGLGHDVEKEIAVVRQGQALLAQGPTGPGVVGYDPIFTWGEQKYDPARAKALLDVYGYADRDGDGWREQPDGSALNIHLKYPAGTLSYRQQTELFSKNMAEIGIRISATAVQFSDLLLERTVGKFQMAQSAWIADYPDAQNFLQLLYGPNTNSSNEARFRLPAYDRLYEQALALPDSPERNRLYREMSRLALVYAPWHIELHRAFTHLIHPWVLGYKKHPIYHFNLLYLDIDTDRQAAGRR